MNTYLWNVSVYRDDRIAPIQTVEIPGSSVDVKTYAKQCQGDRYEAIPRPLECLGNRECQYDHPFFAAKKIAGELPQALVD